MATVESARVGGGFMTVTNTGKKSDRLISATTEISGGVEIHEMKLVNGVMMMRELDPGIEVKPGRSVVLKPFSHHLMLMDLKQPLRAGERIKATLTFETAGKIAVVFDVHPRDSKGPLDAVGSRPLEAARTARRTP